MIKVKKSRQNARLGMATCVACAVSYISVYAFQRLHGFTNPGFLILGLLSLIPAILLLFVSRKKPAPDRTINPLVFVCASIIAAVCVAPAVSSARLYSDFKPYLHIRAWILAIGGFFTVFFLAAYILSLLTISLDSVGPDHQ